MDKVEIRIGAVLTELDQKLREARGKLDEFAGYVKKHSSALKSIRLQAGVALAGEILAIRDLVKAYREQEQADAHLAQAMKNRGIYTVQLMNDYKAFAAEMQQATRFGDEAVQGIMTQLTMFGLQGDAIKGATRAILDFAEAQGMDAVSAGELFAKSIGSSMNALARYGVRIEEGIIGPTNRANALVKAIAELMGGQAAAGANTMSGSLDQLANDISDVKEELGASLMPIISDFAKRIKDALPGFRDFVSENKKLVGVLAGVGVGGTGLILLLAQFALAFTNPVTGVIAVVTLAAIAVAGLVGWMEKLRAEKRYHVAGNLETVAAYDEEIGKLKEQLAIQERLFEGSKGSYESMKGDMNTPAPFIDRAIRNARDAEQEIARLTDELKRLERERKMLAQAEGFAGAGAGGGDTGGYEREPGFGEPEPGLATMPLAFEVGQGDRETTWDNLLEMEAEKYGILNDIEAEYWRNSTDRAQEAQKAQLETWTQFVTSLVDVWGAAFAQLGDVEAKGLNALLIGLVSAFINTIKLVIQAGVNQILAEKIKTVGILLMHGAIDWSALAKIAMVSAAAGAATAALNALGGKATAALSSSVKKFEYGGVLPKAGLYHGEAGEMFFNPAHPVESLRNAGAGGGLNITFNHYGQLRSKDDVYDALRRFEEHLMARRLAHRLG